MDPLKPEAAEVDKLLRQAHVFKMRGEKARAAELIQRAGELDPANPNVWELQGDMLLDLGKLDEARDAFQKSLDAEPGRVSADKKHANALFLIQERNYERKKMEELLLHPELAHTEVTPRKASISAFLSFIVPGSGQLYNGQYLKGGVVLGVSVVVVLFALLHPLPDLKAFRDAITHLIAGKRDAGSPDFWLTLGLFINIVLYVYSVVDAAVIGARLGAGYKPPQRPAPISELDSEPHA